MQSADKILILYCNIAMCITVCLSVSQLHNGPDSTVEENQIYLPTTTIICYFSAATNIN